MGVEPSDFNDHANRCRTSFGDEISRRCVVSRKYYYLFNYIRKNGENHNKADFHPNRNNHKAAEELLEEVVGDDTAEKFWELRRFRNQSDYDLEKSIGNLYVQGAERRLNEILNEIDGEF